LPLCPITERIAEVAAVIVGWLRALVWISMWYEPYADASWPPPVLAERLQTPHHPPSGKSDGRSVPAQIAEAEEVAHS
jgi:hypothetical protein